MIQQEECYESIVNGEFGLNGKAVLQHVAVELKIEAGISMCRQKMVVQIAMEMRKKLKLAILMAALVNIDLDLITMHLESLGRII